MSPQITDVTSAPIDMRNRGAEEIARLSTTPAVPGIDYAASDDDYDAEVEAYEEAWNSLGAFIEGEKKA